VSFQITVLKVLAGQPEGRAPLRDLTRSVAILISSGSDWTDRMKRLAARAPGLDIFSQSFVRRDDAGWEITDAGRAFLASIERPNTVTATDVAPAPTTAVILPPKPASPPMRGTHRRSQRRGRRAAGRVRSSDVA
jgi:hypothetical protein